MQERGQNIQDIFLNKLRKSKTPVTIFLSNGVKLQGNIGGFDNFSVLLKRGPQMQLVYKHTIATVVPAVPVNMFDDDASPSGAQAEYQSAEE